ncbi:hypothetical protein BH23GEM7_BH23GEM7_24660 [soil metagenome]
MKALLRRRWVQALLVAAAVAPPVVMANSPRPVEEVLVLAPQKALPSVEGLDGYRVLSVEEIWRLRAVERESSRLAQSYVRKGYRISEQLTRDIGRAALEYEIDLDIAFGLVRAESAFRNTATSPVGATGLTQLMPRTAAWMHPGTTPRDLRDQSTNLRIGFKYLRYLIDRYDGDTRLALLAYNRGPGTVDKALKRGANPDNGYADFVMGKANHGHKLFTSSTRAKPAPRATAKATSKKPAAAKSASKRPAPAKAKTASKRPAAKKKSARK